MNRLMDPPVPSAPRDDLLGRLSVLGAMTLAMSRATRTDELHREALGAIAAVTGTPKASVLLFDPDGVMRFKAWSSLSEAYRRAVEGHTPWRPGQPDAVPILLPDPAADPGLAAHLDTIRAEGIASMAMFPLIAGGGTIGKFMVYYAEPHRFTAEETQLVQNIAAHTAFALDRLRAVNALRESEERYRLVVDHLTEVVFQVDRAGCWAFLNASWEELSGLAPSLVLSQPLLDSVHEDDRPRCARSLTALLSGEQPHCHLELRIRHRDGTFRWGQLHARAAAGSRGEIIGASGTLTDITERKAATEALRVAEQRLRETQRLESLGVLAGGIAHDFNNLLMGILGNAGIAMAELPPASAAASPLQDILFAARRAADLTRQMLAYSGRGRFVLQRVDLGELVRESAHLLASAISRKATVTYELAARLPEIEGDATQLRQVAMNLLSNASDALEDKPGHIEVRLAVLDADRPTLERGIHGADLAPGRYVSLEVSDTGCGMSEDTVRRMFDPFFTSKAQGRGLGLAAVLGIVRGHHGTIEVTSALGRGTTVRVLLPVPTEASSRAPITRNSERVGAPVRATVLLVDDEDLVRRTIGRMLERLGYRVEVAPHGGLALELLEARRAELDLVLLDLTMPELSGEETVEALRQRWPDLPVILMSGFTAEAARHVGVGPTTFLQKPFDPPGLDAALRRALGLPAAS